MLIKYDLDNKGTGHVFDRKKLICSEKTQFQKIEISDLDILGRVLVLDNIIQLSELDCDRYHEVFAHIPMSNVLDPKNVLILGGGDGILAKELLKYKECAVDMVDIDQRVCELSKKYLCSMHGSSFDSPLLNVVFEDAINFCKRSTSKYDVIFGDITDPHPDSPSSSLMSEEAIAIYKNLLTPDGIFVVQTDNVQIANDYYKRIRNKLQKSYKNTGSFGTIALTLSSVFSFVWATDGEPIVPKPVKVKTDWLSDERIELCHDIIRLATE